MKTRYFKIIMALSCVALLFSSCLKDDSRVFNPESVAPNVAQMPNSGLGNFSTDAITAAGLDTVVFGVGITLSTPPTTATTLTLAVDNTIITAYNAANPAINYLPVPAAAYKLATTVTVPAGQNYVHASVIVDRNQLDPTQSYMLPVKIADAGGLPISSNYYVHYFHIIGNDFAGAYTHDFTRTPAGGNFTGKTEIFFPDSPTQFEVAGGYYTGSVRYVVSFKKTGSGASATYSNFSISINSSDASNILNANGISITTPPTIVGYNAGTNYTFSQALSLFAAGFTYQVLGGSGARTNLDQYHH